MAIIDCKSKKLTKAAGFFAEKLNLADDVFVHIKIKKKLKGIYGYCEYLPETSYILKTFLVVLEKGQQSVEILAHEMVHVAQYARGDLVDGNAHSIWRGEKFEATKVGSEQYYFSPWEVEAYGLSYGLTQLYWSDHELHRGN